MHRPPLLRVLAFAALAVPAPVFGQEPVIPTPEQYAERALSSSNAPLFQSNEPLKITLRSDIKWLRDERSIEEEVAGTVTIHGANGAITEVPVEVRARGNFRRDKQNCNFPPLRLDFPTSEMDGTVFEGQDKLKLVSPCHDSRDSYQDYVLKEYLVYRCLELLTPVSFRTRLVEITYEDVADGYETRTKWGFLIESDEQMAERNHAVYQETDQFHPARVNAEYSVLVSMFQYFIGNTDASPVFFHNVKLIRTEEGQYMTVPYDFDFAGAVNARYAAPDPSLPITRVTQRVYRGFCRPELQREPMLELFTERRATVTDLINGFELLSPDGREKMLEFFGDFYPSLEDEGRFQRDILRGCRNW